ncbi:hypothetical protein [Natranaeroarchaeum aerophilus]|uniref:Uncharacterized protein n=1 Tax=Natranaeroarchaeum aerophilus TaxID=2917711 RepID=A0AAE3FP16_9EURY|nr:hypothetical protein [Natranaeroarchaeum aerophilus]MCL9812506.1 hypothetical protein [Natranaeroarchaeum aerophilus]
MWDTVREITSDIVPSDRNLENIEIEVDALGSDVPQARIEQKEGEEIVVINIDALSDDDFEKVYSGAWMQGGFFDPEIQEDILLVQKALTEDRLTDIVDYYRDYLTKNDVAMIRNALYLRQDWEKKSHYTPKKKMAERLSELSNRFQDDEIRLVANLISSGYYDEGGYIRKIFDSPNEYTNYPTNSRQHAHNYILSNEPFTVYVSKHTKQYMITKRIINKLNDYDSHPIKIEYVDARAQGWENRLKLRKSIDTLHTSSENLKYTMMLDSRETVYRIDCDEFQEADNAESD